MQTHFMRYAGTPASLSGGLKTLAQLLGAMLMMMWVPHTFAHASLIASSPAMGATLLQAPASVRLTFNEPVSPLVIQLILPNGSVQEITQTESLPAGLEVALPATSEQGTYGLSWRVVSADGHPVGGTVTFSVGNAQSNYIQTSSADPDRTFLIWLARFAGYIGAFLGIGMTLWQALCASRENQRRLATNLLALGAVATLLNIGLFGIDALDRPISALFNVAVWQTAFSTGFGFSSALMLAALACAALAWQTTSSLIHRPTAALALVLLATSLATSGHASSASPAWLTQPAVGFHALAVTLWIGSFLPLAHSLQTETKPNLLKFFSRLIPTILIVLFISGGILVYVQFDTLSSLWQTEYGQLLALKLTLLTALIGLGAYNRYRLTSAVQEEQPNARNAMRRVIHLECVLAVAIFATVALWRFTPPPRALNSAVQSTPTISAHIHADNASADLSWTRSARTQTSTLTIYLSKADLTPLNAQEVSVAFTNAGAGIQPIDFSAKRTNDGAWQITNVDLPNLPTWHIRINALITDFERIHLETTLGGDK
tara:strand:- start:11625 stop:13259 length:1635 start_codon:yes stop_codon:yes gene_type:complete